MLDRTFHIDDIPWLSTNDRDHRRAGRGAMRLWRNPCGSKESVDGKEFKEKKHMNKKLLASAGALTVVVVGGYLAYRWVSTKQLDLFLEDETEDKDLWPLGKLTRTSEQRAHLEKVLRDSDSHLSDILAEEGL